MAAVVLILLLVFLVVLAWVSYRLLSFPRELPPEWGRLLSHQPPPVENRHSGLVDEVHDLARMTQWQHDDGALKRAAPGSR